MPARKPGRPSKFTPETRRIILKHLRAGSTVKATCDSVGVGVSTYFEWLEIGRAHLNGDPHPRMPRRVSEREVYADFAEATTRAIAHGLTRAAAAFRRGMNASESVSHVTETLEETRLDKEGKPYLYTKTVTKHTITKMPGDWRAAMEYLARRDPDNWARVTPQRIEHTGKDGGPIELSWQDEAAQLIKAGHLTYAMALETFDGNDTLVRELFAKAQIPVSIGQAEDSRQHPNP